MASDYGGQAALRPLPPSPDTVAERTLESYVPPTKLQAEPKNLRNSVSGMAEGGGPGIEVVKVTKNGRFQPRRIALSPDNRTLLVTTTRIRSLKGLIKYALPQTREVSARSIDMACVDRIQRGRLTKKFALARKKGSPSASPGRSRSSFSRSAAVDDSMSVASAVSSYSACDAQNSVSIIYRPTSFSSLDAFSLRDAGIPGTSNSSLSSSSKSQGAAHPPNRLESLDLVVPNFADYETICRTLEELIELNRADWLRHDFDAKFLMHHWIESDKRLSERLSSSEFLGMCDRWNVPLKKSKLSGMYKDYARSLGLEEHGPSLREAGGLLHWVRRASLANDDGGATPLDPRLKLWDEIASSDPKRTAVEEARRDDDDDGADSLMSDSDLDDENEEWISAVAFLSFVRTTQKEFTASLEDVKDLFGRVNSMIGLERLKESGAAEDAWSSALARPTPSVDKIGRRRFVEFLASDANDIMDPAKGSVGSCDMTKPLCNYWINSSHDTYLEWRPNSFVSSSLRTDEAGEGEGEQKEALEHYEAELEMYQAALYRGVRCIELDVWDGGGEGEPEEPLVARRKSSGSDPTDAISEASSSSPSKKERSKRYENYRKRVEFSSILTVVRTYLQTHPESYPIVLFLECHCTTPYQTKMVEHLDDILVSADLLYEPPELGPKDEEPMLPSPEELRGMVVIKGKKPLEIKEGATIVNDDFDDENDIDPDDAAADEEAPIVDDETDEDIQGYVVGFEAMGSVVSDAPNEVARTPAELLAVAEREAEDAKQDATRAEAKAFELQVEADAAEEHAMKLLGKIGMKVEDLEGLRDAVAEEESVPSPGANTVSTGESESIGDDDKPSPAVATDHPFDEDDDPGEGIEVDLAEVEASFQSRRPETTPPPAKPQSKPAVTPQRASQTKMEEGLEVSSYFATAVEKARSSYGSADARALGASEALDTALVELNRQTDAVRSAEEALQNSIQREKDLAEAAAKATNEVRANREHAETARQRVGTVRKLLDESTDACGSAETVLGTAVTEAKISEQRAREIESKHARAQSTAKRDRSRADAETKKEERLEFEAAQLQTKCANANEAARVAKQQMDRAKIMLDKVVEQIKLIEKSSQYRREKMELKQQMQDQLEGEEVIEGRFVQKHREKVEERSECTEIVRRTTAEHKMAETNLKTLKAAFSERAYKSKTQSEIAIAARRQADHSTNVAEQIAEHAEEEREAANLRHRASQKAKESARAREANRVSMEGQLAEAERAANEAADIAAESRRRAEQLAKESLESKDHSKEERAVEEQKELLALMQQKYDAAKLVQDVALTDANDAKRLLETSSEVFTRARREAASEVHKANAERQAERNAVAAHDRAKSIRTQAAEAKSEAKLAVSKAADKVAAARHAREYKSKKAMVKPILPELARMTLIHSTKFKYWEKSLTLPYSHMHSLSEGLMMQFAKKSSTVLESFVEFNKNHMSRAFPSWKSKQRSVGSNCNPLFAWSMGCQLVSMNFHSCDEHLLLNDGRFRQNGSCGFVLKPHHLTDDGVDGLPTDPEAPQTWNFQVLCGSCLPKPEGENGRRGLSVGGVSIGTVSPLVRVALYDVSLDGITSIQEHNTQIAKRNGVNPIWDETDGIRLTVANPSIAILLFTVWDSDVERRNADEFIAASAVPISCLREGYRSVPLFDSNHTRCGPYEFASLVVKSRRES